MYKTEISMCFPFHIFYSNIRTKYVTFTGLTYIESSTRNAERGTRNVEHGTRNVERGTRNVEHGTRNVEHGTRNTERGTRNAERGTRNAEHGTRNTERGTRNAEHGTRNTEHQTSIGTSITSNRASLPVVISISSVSLTPNPSLRFRSCPATFTSPSMTKK